MTSFRQKALVGRGACEGKTEPTGRFLWEVHHYINEYIRFADTKAAFVAATSTALAGALVSSSVLDSSFRKLPSLWSGLQWTAAVGLLLLSVSLLLSVAAVRPRLWNKTYIGYIFWDSIPGHGTAELFSAAIRKLPVSQRTTALSDHLFALATVAKRKYAYVKLAVHVGLLGGVLAGSVLFLQHALR